MAFREACERVKIENFIAGKISGDALTISPSVMYGDTDAKEAANAVAEVINQYTSVYNEALRMNDFTGLFFGELNKVIPAAKSMGAEFPVDCTEVGQQIAFSLRFILDSVVNPVE